MNDSLEHFVESVNGTGHLRIEHDFGDGFVRLQTSEAERRQAAQDIRCSENIVLEMLRNSRDAHASHIFVALAREGSKRIINVIDDGCGIPKERLAGLFTGYLDRDQTVSDGQRKGMGIGLFVCAAIIRAHGGEITASNLPGGGAAFRFALDTEEDNEQQQI